MTKGQADVFDPSEDFARQLDADDPLAVWRGRFHIPKQPGGDDAIYFCGNSLGLQPNSIAPAVEEELEDWARLAVDAHFEGRHPWYPYHEAFRDSGARLVGGLPGEVVYMNGLTVNLHLMMVSFYRPTRERHKVLMEDCAFPSDTYAVKTQIAFHGFEPASSLLIARPRPGEPTIRTEDIEALLEEQGDRIALVMMGGVNYFTGQLFDMERIAAKARRKGCIVGFDLAHAAGNVPLRLHDWGVDFAVWCTYKYLNCGPGSVAGCFIQEKHGQNAGLPRLGGWWGNDPAQRFKMHLLPDFLPREGADGWQLSNPPILSMAALRASLAMFDEVGMEALRAKSLRLTGYLEFLIDRLPDKRFEAITPRNPAERGCQLSLRVKERPEPLFSRLKEGGVVCDIRRPDVIRAAPVPFYNTFHEVWRFASLLRGA